MFMSALSCGIPWAKASSMPFGTLQAFLMARNELYQSDEGDETSPDGRKVRDATQADISRFLGC